MENSSLSWRARTRPKHERSRLWYLLAGTFVGILLVYGIQDMSWGFTVLVIMCAAVYYIFALRPEPTVKNISLTEEGVQLDYEFYPWHSLVGFWFQKYPDYTQFHVEHKETWRYDLIIQTGPVSVSHIRTILSAHLPEHADRTERKLDKISRLCKI